MNIYLSEKQARFLFDVLDNLTDRCHSCEIGDDECRDLAYPLFKKLRLALKGY